MATSRDNVETFLRSPGVALISQQLCTHTETTTITEALTPQNQMREMFHVVEEGASQTKASFYQIISQEEPELMADLEQRQQCSKMTQTDKTMDKSQRLGDKQTKVDIKNKMEETEQVWEDTQRDSNETEYLKTKIEQQEEDINRLTSDKYEQCLLINRLKLQMLNVIEKLKENKNEATQEKMQLMQTWAEIHQEREALERRHSEMINKRYKLEVIINEKTKSQDGKKEPNQQIPQEQEKVVMPMGDRLQSLINNNKKIILRAKQGKEQIEKNTVLKQELKRNREDLSQHKDEIQHIKHNMNVITNKLKKRLIQQQNNVQMQKAKVPEMESKERQKEEHDTSKHSEKENEVSLTELKADQKEKMTSDSQKLRQHTDIRLTITKWETERWQQMKADMQRQQQHIEDKLAQVLSERDEINIIKTKIHTDRENLEIEKQLAKAEMNDIKCMRESIECQKQELDNKLQRTKKEIRELEETKIEIEIKKKNLVKMMRMSRRKRELNKLKENTEHAKQDIERREEHSEGKKSEQVQRFDTDDNFDEEKIQQTQNRMRIIQQTVNHIEEDNMEKSMMNKVNADIQRVILNVDNIRKILHMVREDTDQSRTDFTEEKSKIKWMNCQAQEKRQELDQQLERTMQERDDLEIMKIKTQQQRKEFEKKLEDTMTKILTMAEMKTNIEKAAAEMNTRKNASQRQIDENKEEAKNYIDKMTSMKTQVSKWILTESAIKKTFSLDRSKLQEPQNEIHRDSLKDQTSENPTDKEVKSQKQMHSAERQQFSFVAEEQNIFLQMQTETQTEDDQKELVINIRDIEEIENEISKLKEKGEKIKEQIKYFLKDMADKNQEIRSHIVEINDLQSKRPELKIIFNVNEIGNLQEIRTGVLKEKEHANVLRINTDEIIKYKVQVQKEEDDSKVKKEVIDQSDLMRLDFKWQKQYQESRKHLQTQTDRCSDKKDTRSPNIQKLREEIYRTREIIKFAKLELEHQDEQSTINRDDEDSTDIEGLLRELKQFQELFKMVKNEMRQNKIHLKEETDNMKLMKNAAKKQKRQLDQRLEKTLRERDELDILKVKMQRQTEVIEQKMEKIKKIKSIIETMEVKTSKKSEYIDIIMNDTKVKMRCLEDLNYNIEAKKQDLMNRHYFISQETADLGKCKTQKTDRVETDTDKFTGDRKGKEMENEIFKLKSEKEKLKEDIKLIIDSLNQKKCENEHLRNTISEQEKQKVERVEMEMLKKQIQAERENVRLVRHQAEAEIHEMNNLRESIERQKHQLDDKMQMAKREMREMELLKSELEIKRKQSEQTFRKSMRKQEEGNIMWKEIHRQKELLRRETMKRRKELDQKLENAMRERDEFEIIRIKLQREKEEVGALKQRNKNLERETSMGETRLIYQCLKVNDFIIDLQNLRQKIYVHLGKIMKEMKILENVHVHLEKQRHGVKVLKADFKRKIDDVRRIKSQIKLPFAKEMDEMVLTRNDNEKLKQELDIRQGNVNIEREIEVLKFDFEVKKRENQEKIQRRIQKEPRARRMWPKVKLKKDVLKNITHITQKRKKNHNRQLKRIVRVREELDMNNKKEEIEVEMKSISVERKQLNQIKKGIAQGKGILFNEKEDIEVEKSELKVREHQLMTDMKSVETLRTNLKHVNESIDEEMTSKFNRIEQTNQGIFDLVSVLQQKHAALDEQKEKMTRYTEMLQKIKETLMSLLANTAIQRADMENQSNHLFEMEKQDVENLRNELKTERENLDRVTEIMKKDNLVLERLKSDVLKQSDILQRYEKDVREDKDMLGINRTGLQKKKEHADNLFDEVHREKANIKVLTVQVHSRREQLETIMKTITSKQKEQEVRDYSIRKQEEELQTIKKNALAERDEVELLRKDLNNKKEEIELAMNSISVERKQVNQIKKGIEREKEILFNEKEAIEVKKSQLKVRKDKLMTDMKFGETLKSNFKNLNERMDEEMKTKFKRLEENNKGIFNLVSVLQQKHAALDEQKEKMTRCTKMLQKIKEGLASLLSTTAIQRADMEKKWNHMFEMEKQDVENLKNELKVDRENLDRMTEIMKNEKLGLERLRSDVLKQYDILQQCEKNTREYKEKLEITKSGVQKKKQDADNLFDEINREKANIKVLTIQVQSSREQLEKSMNTIASKQKEHKVKDGNMRSQEEELQTIKMTVRAEREEVELLRKDINNKKEEIDLAMNSISVDREQIIQIKKGIEREKEILFNEKEEIELEKSELKLREDQLMTNMKSVETLRTNLKHVNESIDEEMTSKFNRIEQTNQGIFDLVSVLQQKHAALDEQKEKVTRYTEMLQKIKETLMSLLANTVIQRADMKNQSNHLFEMEKQDVENLRNELKTERENLDRVTEIMKKDNLVLERLKSDVLKQSDLLQQYVQNTREYKEKLEIMKTALQKKKKYADSIFDEIKREKANIKVLSIHVQSRREHLEKIMNTIASKQNEQEVKDDNIRRQEELQTIKMAVLAVTEELELLRKDLNNKKKDIEVAMNSISVKTNQLSQIKNGIEREKEILVNDTDEKISKTDCLRKIWKDTKTEQKEIDQMKRRGHEMRNNLEKRLKVINRFVKKTWIHREKKPLGRTNLEQGLTRISQCDWERDCKTLDEKHNELQHLKVQMLSEIGKLQVKDKVSRTLKTCNKANQTFQVHKRTEHASTKAYQEQMEIEQTEAAPHTSSGLLCQLCYYCYHYCCPSCACFGQLCPEER